MAKLKLATVWLDGCSGCHMSLLDMDERLIEVLQHADLVYSPLVDAKEFPADVDITLVEGAVSSEHDLEKLKLVRHNSKLVVVLGDCAVTGNVPSMRNAFGRRAVLRCAYVENASLGDTPPDRIVPRLLPHVRPVGEVVDVDVFVPGCPPSADTIYYALQELVAGRVPDFALSSRFGA
jgi:NAD-reducing hydrogenase small subunit